MVRGATTIRRGPAFALGGSGASRGASPPPRSARGLGDFRDGVKRGLGRREKTFDGGFGALFPIDGPLLFEVIDGGDDVGFRLRRSVGERCG